MDLHPSAYRIARVLFAMMTLIKSYELKQQDLTLTNNDCGIYDHSLLHDEPHHWLHYAIACHQICTEADSHCPWGEILHGIKRGK